MDQRENTLQLLHSLGYIYANHGQTKRALVLQLLASRLEPENRYLLRTLAYTFLNDGAPDRALAVISRLRALEEDDPSLDLLQSRALWLTGQGWKHAGSSNISFNVAGGILMLDYATRVATALSRRSDLVIALIIVTAVIMMIIPCRPSWSISSLR